MPVLVRVTVPNPDDILAGYGAGALIRVERATTQDGAYSEVATRAVVVDGYSYEIWDTTGSTTSWYRTRYSNSGGTTFSLYGDPLTPAAPETYATLDDLLLRSPHVPADTRILARMEQALVEATERVNQELGGITFFRSPRSGADEVRTFTVEGDGVVHIHEGIAALTSVRMRRTHLDDFEDVDIGDLELEYWAGGNRASSAPAGEPWDHISVTGRGTLLHWPTTRNGIELTGAYNWPAIQALARNATAAWARQDLSADPSFPGGIVGPDELGQPLGPNRMPDAVWRLQAAMSKRFIGCSL